MGDNQQDKDIAVLQTNYLNMSEQIKDLKKSVDNGFAKMEEQLKCWQEDADKKYASKLTEKIVYTMASLILLAFFGGIVTIVIK